VLIDLSVSSKEKLFNHSFDIVIADVPCSGSGTWSRTPEALAWFEKKAISNYVLLQQKIVAHSIEYLKENGLLLYITCSVFKKENEDNVDFFRQDLSLELISSKYLAGYKMQADTLFIALLRKKKM